MNDNFRYWYNEIADMPEYDETGKYWYDLETGLRYDPSCRYLPQNSRKPVSDKALAARSVAKKFGGRALKGTSKQVRWAEEIRASVITQIPENAARICCNPDGLMKSAKFWIENRHKPATAFADFAINHRRLLADYQAAHNAGDAPLVAEIAGKYNALTTLWGFTG
ncbi:TPA: hypothetical protein JGU28_004675 [Salmonella enterica]|nr:hypothetical protein [Salmonella enterica]